MTQLFICTCSADLAITNRQADRHWAVSTTIQDVSNNQRLYYSDIFIIYFIPLINEPTLTTMSMPYMFDTIQKGQTLTTKSK